MENPSPIEIPILIVIATCGILVFIFFIVLFVVFYQKRNLQLKVEAEEKEKIHQKNLLNTSLEIAERERNKIAANLHDDIGPIINIVKHNISRIVPLINDQQSNDLKSQSDKLLEDTMDNIRNITRELSPPVLMKFGFEEGLRSLCSQLSNSNVLQVDFNKTGSEVILPGNIQIQFYRLIQEIINNIVKHANASKLVVNLMYHPSEIIIDLVHDGKGISNEEINELTRNSKGLGLKSIKNRAEILKSKIEYTNLAQPIIKITLPVNPHEKAN